MGAQSPDPTSCDGGHVSPRVAAWLRSTHRKLADDKGMALVMAVGILLVLSITVTSVISYSSASARNSNVDTSTQRAYALAEAGVNDALSIITKTGSTTGAIGAQPAYAGDTSGGATVTTYQGGDTATWGASWVPATRTWTIKSIGSVNNPTGSSASNLTHTLYASAVVAAPPYSFVSLDSSCDSHELVIRSSGTLTVTNAIYDNSCDMGNDAFDVFGTGGSIAAPGIKVVGGWETHNGNPVIVNGVTCPYLNANPPALLNPGTPVAGCPTMGQPVLADPFVNVAGPTLSGSGACTSAVYGTAASYTALATKPKTTAAMLATPATGSITFSTTNPGWIQNGDVIAIQNEWFLVTSGGNTATITATRAYNGTTAAAHASATEVKKVPVSTGGSAATPLQCDVSTGTVTLQPGTYYGGICIGGTAGTDCTGTNCVATPSYTFAAYSPAETLSAALDATSTSTVLTGSSPIAVGDVMQIETEWLVVTGVTTGGSGKTLTTTISFTRGAGGTTAAAHAANKAIQKGTAVTGAPSVTMAAGTYIMAGGGFHLCGLASLSAPNVMIYNTQDPSLTTGAGALDQILINTFGNVTLGPQIAGTYAGLTIFQDRTLGLLPTTKCDGRSVDQTDIAIAQAASTGANGQLGSVSGTFYAPGPKALFADYVSGKANLAVITSCILIDGGDAIFDFQLSGLFGVGLQVQKVWG